MKKAMTMAGVALMLLACMAPAGAQEVEHGVADAAEDMSFGQGLRAAGLAIGAGLAILGGAIGTGRAQASIGAGGTGAMAEKPELFGRVFILVALPETMVVLGFVLGILILVML